MTREGMALAAHARPVVLLAAAGRVEVARGFEGWDGLRRQFDVPEDAITAFAEAFGGAGEWEWIEEGETVEGHDVRTWSRTVELPGGEWWSVNVEVMRRAFGGVWAVCGVSAYWGSDED